MLSKRNITVFTLLYALIQMGTSMGQDSAPSRNPKVLPAGVATNFTSKAARFSIYFPTKPTQKRTPISSSEGKHEELLFQSKSGWATYHVVATTLPSGLRTPTSTSLERLRRGFERVEAGAKLEKTQKITWRGVPGYEIHRSEKNGIVLTRIRILCAPKTVYLVIATYLSQKSLNRADFQAQFRQVEKVLNSFYILTP